MFKDMLLLRVALLAATVFYVAYGLYEPVWTMVWWNLPVGALHIWAIWQLLKDRRGIHLDDEASAIHTLLFSDLTRVSFNAMWHCGEERTVANEVLITKGEPVTELLLILEGEVEAHVRDGIRIRLSEYRMLGEISTLRGTNATATVTALGPLRFRAWDKAELDACGEKYPDVKIALLKAMGLEAATKVD